MWIRPGVVHRWDALGDLAGDLVLFVPTAPITPGSRDLAAGPSTTACWAATDQAWPLITAALGHLRLEADATQSTRTWTTPGRLEAPIPGRVARGHLPWRLWVFLDDAHHRGTLRQAGTAWQFRHALLQDRLGGQARGTRVGAGDQTAARKLADLLVEHGRLEELRARADAGDWHAILRLPELLADNGRVDEAISLLRARADAGD